MENMENKQYEAPQAEVVSFENEEVFGMESPHGG